MALLIAFAIVCSVLLISFLVIFTVNYQTSKVVWKPHVYRSIDGRYHIRAYYLFGYKWLHYSDWKFTPTRRQRRDFFSLEDATQAFERFQEKSEEYKEYLRQRKEKRKAAKAASGIVHRF